jgi:chemotaxis protein MotA
VDKSTFGGIVIALAGIGCGLVLDGGRLSQVIQPTAALIVLGGTIGAVMVQYPLPIVLQALAQLKEVFLSKEPESDALVQNLLRYALKARKEGLLSLDAELAKIHDPFLKESLMLAIDGVNATDLRRERRARSQGLRVRSRLCSYHWHYRSGAGADPGDAASTRH